MREKEGFREPHKLEIWSNWKDRIATYVGKTDGTFHIGDPCWISRWRSVVSDSADSLEKGPEQPLDGTEWPTCCEISAFLASTVWWVSEASSFDWHYPDHRGTNTNTFLNAQGQRYFLFCELLVLFVLPAGLWELFPHLNINLPGKTNGSSIVCSLILFLFITNACVRVYVCVGMCAWMCVCMNVCVHRYYVKVRGQLWEFVLSSSRSSSRWTQVLKSALHKHLINYSSCYLWEDP